MNASRRSFVIFGATSAVAQALARLHARDGDALLLVARNTGRLESMAADLRVRGAGGVDTVTADLADTPNHPGLLQQIEEKAADADGYYFFHGVLPDQKACEASPAATLEALNVNFLSHVSLLTLIAAKIEKHTGRTIVVVSSVSGDRGRQSNYVYGAGKGALNVFLQGLRNRLHRSGNAVVTVKPGFIDTPMTRHVDKNFLFASPERVARDIHRTASKGRNTVYTPWFWRYIMLIIKSIPEPIFKRLSL